MSVSRHGHVKEESRKALHVLCHIGNATVFCLLKVYLVGHMPPGVDERQNGGISPYHEVFQERFNQRYIRLVQKYSDIIVGQFFGHLHSDSFRIVYSDGKIYRSPTQCPYLHLHTHIRFFLNYNQQHATIFYYLFLKGSTCFGRFLRPSSGAYNYIQLQVLSTNTAASSISSTIPACSSIS